MTQRLELKVPTDFEPIRLDHALSRLIPDQSRNFLARCIEEGLVRVDGKTAAKRSQILPAGTTVEIDLPDALPSTSQSQDIPLEILYQDDAIAVIVKPAGMVVHPSAGHADETLVNALLFHLTNLSAIGGEIRPGIVHRLDKDTSGVMIIAKTDAAHRQLTSHWNTDEVRKEYLALVYGKPKVPQGRLEGSIGRDPRDRKKMAVVSNGREALTLYRTVEELRYLALLRCTLKTGRTHQIRVHLKALGHPIVGDPLYSGPQWKGIPDKRLQRLLAGFGRQALHAAKLVFPHPTTGESMTFESPIPADMSALIEDLRTTQQSGP